MPQAVGISCRAWPGMVTDHHVHTWPALSSPFLCWFMFVLSQTTMTPPFPFLWSFLRLPMGNLAHSPNYLCGFPSWISDVMQNPPCSAGEVMLESSAIDPLGESFMRRCQNFPYIIYLLILNWNGPKILSTAGSLLWEGTTTTGTDGQSSWPWTLFGMGHSLLWTTCFWIVILITKYFFLTSNLNLSLSILNAMSLPLPLQAYKNISIFLRLWPQCFNLKRPWKDTKITRDGIWRPQAHDPERMMAMGLVVWRLRTEQE